MQFNDEKDYIMRMIKEMVRVLFSLMLGKQYKQVELQDDILCKSSANRFESGRRAELLHPSFLNYLGRF